MSTEQPVNGDDQSRPELDAGFARPAASYMREQVDFYERRARLARWSLIPYGVFALINGFAIGVVFRDGMGRTGWALAVSYVGVICLQWIMPLLMRYWGRGEVP